MTKEGSITDSITAEHILTKLLRLAQITSGHVKYDEVWENGVLVRPASVTQISDKNPKVDAVLDIYAQDQADDSNGKMVIWAIFDEDIRILSEALAKQGINHVGYKPQVVKEFRKSGADLAEIEFNTNPDCKIFLGNPKSGGSALNLVGYNFRDAKCSDTSYCNHVIFFSKSWSMIDRAQAQDRSAERRSSRCNVRVTDLEIVDSIDTVIRERVFGKMQMASVLQDIREILNQVLKIEEYVEE
jgi:SNF2 family DNA or RNA helicase